MYRATWDGRTAEAGDTRVLARYRSMFRSIEAREPAIRVRTTASSRKRSMFRSIEAPRTAEDPGTPGTTPRDTASGPALRLEPDRQPRLGRSIEGLDGASLGECVSPAQTWCLLAADGRGHVVELALVGIDRLDALFLPV